MTRLTKLVAALAIRAACKIIRHAWRDTGRKKYGIAIEQQCVLCRAYRHRRLAPWDYEAWDAWHAGHHTKQAVKAKGGVCKPTSTNTGK